MKVRSIQLVHSASGRAAPRYLIPMALLAALLLAVASVTWAGSAHADDDDGAGEFAPRQVVVKLKPGAKIGAINDKYRTRTLEKLLGSRGIYLLRTPKGKDPATLSEQMQNDRRIIYAEPNFKTASPEGDRSHRAFPGITPTPSSDPAPYTDQYAITNLNLEAAHEITRGAGSVVAVIDTGVQLDHPELAGSLTDARYDFIDDDGVPTDDGNGRDDDGDGYKDEMAGHGTHVAGIVHLAAPSARIMPLRALNSDGWGNVFVIAEAINYASLKGADAINLSLGATRESDLLEDILDNVVEGEEGMPGGTAFAGAAGNQNTNKRQYPAAEEDVLAITSVNRKREKSSFANYGSTWVDIAAPGSKIYSTFPTDQYAYWSGTSMATPFVAGQAALLHGMVPSTVDEPEEKVECVNAVIKLTAQPLSDKRLGKGHADAGASVEYLKSNGCPMSDDDDD